MLADDSRVAMLDLLLDGQAHPVGELAQAAGITPSTASEHLARLAGARLVSASRDGRRRLYALAHPGVATVLEALSALKEVEIPRGLRGWARMESLREARTCYDHLAGRLGVALADAAQTAGAFSSDMQLQPSAGEWLDRVGG